MRGHSSSSTGLCDIFPAARAAFTGIFFQIEQEDGSTPFRPRFTKSHSLSVDNCGKMLKIHLILELIDGWTDGQKHPLIEMRGRI